MCPNPLVKAFILDQDNWDEIRRREGKNAGTPYVVPSHRVISIRIPEEYAVGSEVVVFAIKPQAGGM